MAVTQLSTLTNSLKVQRTNDYQQGGIRRRLYDILAQPINETSGAAGAAQAMADLCRGGTVRLTYISDMAVTTTPLSEVQDIVPQVLADAVVDVNVDMFGDGIQTSQKALIEHFTNYDSRSPRAVGLNMMELVDFKAMEAALGGALVQRNGNRSDLDAGTTASRANETIFANVAGRLSHFNIPGWEGEGKAPSWAGITDHFVLNDIATGGNVVNVGIYQDKDIILNNEVGRLHNFKILASGWAKILYGAGADAHSTVATTLSSAAARLATTIVLGTTTNLAVGYWLNLYGTEETASTFYPDSERVKITSLGSGNSIVIAGEGENGGLRFAHPAGTNATDADSAHIIMFGGPMSLAKVYAPSVGEFGELVGPKQQGLAEQWTSYAWKWFGGYGRTAENLLYRAEVSVSEEA